LLLEGEQEWDQGNGEWGAPIRRLKMYLRCLTVLGNYKLTFSGSPLGALFDRLVAALCRGNLTFRELEFVWGCFDTLWSRYRDDAVALLASDVLPRHPTPPSRFCGSAAATCRRGRSGSWRRPFRTLSAIA
jgi:hypothetical protein